MHPIEQNTKMHRGERTCLRKDSKLRSCGTGCQANSLTLNPTLWTIMQSLLLYYYVLIIVYFPFKQLQTHFCPVLYRIPPWEMVTTFGILTQQGAWNEGKVRLTKQELKRPYRCGRKGQRWWDTHKQKLDPQVEGRTLQCVSSSLAAADAHDAHLPHSLD